MGRESGVHSACRAGHIAHAFRAAVKLTHIVVTGDVQKGHELDGQSRQWVIQRVKYKKSIYQNLVTRPRVQNFL